MDRRLGTCLNTDVAEVAGAHEGGDKLPSLRCLARRRRFGLHVSDAFARARFHAQQALLRLRAFVGVEDYHRPLLRHINTPPRPQGLFLLESS